MNRTHLVFYGLRCFVASSDFRPTLGVRSYRWANVAPVDPSRRPSFCAPLISGLSVCAPATISAKT